ncbi:MAG: hypothetical protein QOD33_766 [Pyrinomonadaceae bacterium]|jgi:hypothetical protein|nr:hypothetical protein [Pyrinomonadaceae bacterium]
MPHPSRSLSTSLEEWRIIFLCRLFWLSVAWLIALFTLAILSGLNVIVLPYGLPLFCAGTTGGVFGLFSFPLRWLFQKQTRLRSDQAASVQNSGLMSSSNML